MVVDLRRARSTAATYHFEARARDTDNSLSSPVRTVDVRLSKPDNAAPDTALDTPAEAVDRCRSGPVALDGHGVRRHRCHLR